MAQRYGTPVGRSRHGKRLPQVSNGSEGPVDQPAAAPIITPTVTIFVQASPTAQPTLVSGINQNAGSSPIVVTPTETPVSSGSAYGYGDGYGGAATDNTPTTNTGKTNAAQGSPPAPSKASSSSGTPIGAIVGIVLAIVILLGAGALFWFRRRAVINRLKTRQWTKQQKNAPSFLWIEPAQSTITPFPVMSARTLQPYRGGDPEANVNMVFAGPSGGPSASYAVPTNNGLPFIPHPAPPRPPPAAGMYDVSSSAPTPVAPSTNLPVPNASARPLPAQPVSPGPPSSPAPNKPAESAKVRATFIPTLPDELSIGTGEMVRIHAEYDDGWALCANARGEMGMVPLECLDKASEKPKASNQEYRKSVRVSSLAATPKSAYSGYQSPTFTTRSTPAAPMAAIILADEGYMEPDGDAMMASFSKERLVSGMGSVEEREDTPLIHHDGVNDSDDEGMGDSDSDSDGDNGDRELIINDVEAAKAELTLMHAEMDSGFASTSFTGPPVLEPESSMTGTRYTHPVGSPGRSRARPYARHSAPPVLKSLGTSSYLTPDYKLLYQTHTKLHNRFLHSSYRLSALQTRGLYTYPSGLQVLFTGSRDRTVREWNMTTGLVERVIGGVHTGSVLSVCAHGGYLASAGSDKRVVVWDLEKNKAHKVLLDHLDSVLCVRFDDERLVSCSKAMLTTHPQDYTVRTYSFPDLAPQFTLRAHRAAVNAVSISKDLIASGSGDKSIKLWDAHSGKLLRTFDLHHHRGIASIDFQYPHILTGSSDKHLRLVDVLNPKHGWSTSLEYQYNPLELGSPSVQAQAAHVPPGSRFMCQCCGSEDVQLVPSGDQGPCAHTDLVRSVVLGEDFVVSGSYDLSIKVGLSISSDVIRG
ncbi:hypothetical protein DXG01_011684 [Tephrocybe rancida]|nr:hypothetical protein DXG01_011684 [Tephrocybe rancida]